MGPVEACCLVILAAESKVSRVGTWDPGSAHPHPYPGLSPINSLTRLHPLQP